MAKRKTQDVQDYDPEPVIIDDGELNDGENVKVTFSGGPFVAGHAFRFYVSYSFLRVSNADTGKILADRAVEARTFGARFLGLMGRRELAVGDGLHIVPCNGIHTFFMRIPIDAVFLEGELRVRFHPERSSADTRGLTNIPYSLW